MATTSNQAVDFLKEILNKSSSDVVTLTWGQLYTALRRERMSEDFIADVGKKAKAAGLNIAFGNSTILIGKDYPFSPPKNSI